MRTPKFPLLAAPGLIFLACGGSSVKEDPGGTSGTDPDTYVLSDPGTVVSLSLSAAAGQQKTALDAALGEVRELDAAGFAERTAVPFGTLSYDPGEAEGLDLIANSSLGLNAAELARLESTGFVITDRNSFPTFTYGYASIYADDLPIYVSADSILHALHKSYDNILKAFEAGSLLPGLEGLLSGMIASLEGASHPGDLRRDLDVFLSVAQSLLTDELVAPLDSANSSIVTSLFAGCKAAAGTEEVEIFGARRLVDYSQCQPRGHYTDDPNLERYFRAMMWLGRIDFRLIETQPDGTSLFHRRQLEASWALVELMGEAEKTTHKGIDDFITAFVGEHDYMTVSQFAGLKSDLGVSSLAEIADISDEVLAQAIVDGGYGTQRISSHYMVNGGDVATLPLSSSFAFFGQRYVIDSHVFSNVVFDRVAGRMMPNPLDVAYAALGNDQAGMLLEDEITQYQYAPALAQMRTIADSEPESFWELNLYNRWLGALRELSPAKAQVEGADEALPEIAQTEAWGERLLNTQLASWAELRHDTILYVKQSYSAGFTCEFPDAYVEPYPAFFGALEDYAGHANNLIAALPFPAPSGAKEHFENFARVTGILREMAEHQRTGTPHTEEHMAFINDMVALQTEGQGCLAVDVAVGWYPGLIFGDPLEYAPTIADVHTQPEDENGATVGKILHVGTGSARLMVTTIETCSGPRAYAGLVSSYYERIEEDWNRLTDPEWANTLNPDEPLRSPEWIEQHIVPAQP